MFLLNIKTEFKIIYRNYWLTALTLLLLALCLYAGWNGQQHVEQRQKAINGAYDEMKTSDILLDARLDSLSKGLKINGPEWFYPNLPTATGNKNPRVAAFEPGNLSVIATGQSDLFNHYVKPTLTGDSFRLSFTELTSPIRLLMGNFDLSFVLVYLLPLVIISFCYNILSGEKEKGSLVLIASNPQSLKTWLAQKIFLRFGLITGLLILFILLTLKINNVLLNSSVLALLLAVVLYSMFWFSLSFLINLKGKSSERNAITLLGLWVALVLIIPSLISQVANTFHPVPSRTLLINEMRVLENETNEEQDKILDNYMRDHPELVVRDANGNVTEDFWQKYFASKDMVAKKITPLLARYDNQLRLQQDLINQFRFLSPAILLQNNLTELAETSTDHYAAYHQSVRNFQEEWQSFFLPMVFLNKPFTKEMISQFPQFRIESSNIKSHLTTNSLITLLFIVALIAISLTQQKRQLESR